jgi:hypothetical protein
VAIRTNYGTVIPLLSITYDQFAAHSRSVGFRPCCEIFR